MVPHLQEIKCTALRNEEALWGLRETGGTVGGDRCEGGGGWVSSADACKSICIDRDNAVACGSFATNYWLNNQVTAGHRGGKRKKFDLGFNLFCRVARLWSATFLRVMFMRWIVRRIPQSNQEVFFLFCWSIRLFVSLLPFLSYF